MYSYSLRIQQGDMKNKSSDQVSRRLFLSCDKLNHFQSHRPGPRPDQRGYWGCQDVSQSAFKKKKFKGKLTGVGGWGKGDVLIHAYERFFLNLMLLFLASNICRRATYFSSCSLSGETLDCFHLFNFHVPLSGFLWSEPLCHQWHLIDVFHINQRVIPQIDDISFKCDSLVFVCVSLTLTQSCTLK